MLRASDSDVRVPPRRRGGIETSHLVPVVAVATLALSWPCASSARSSIEDVTFDAEHLLEAGMDARYASLPLIGDPLQPGAWQPTVTVSWADTGAGLYDLGGAGVGLGLARGVSAHWGVQAFGSYHRSTVSGQDANDELLPLFVADLPFAVPENADFSEIGGEVRQEALGVVATHQRIGKGDAEGVWSMSFGLLVERLEARDFTTDYRLTGGELAGTEGVLDLSADYTYVTPIFDLRYGRSVGHRWRLEPRATIAVPRPSRGFEGRIQGPGFDLAGDTAQTGRGVHMGDPALVLGLGLEHRPSHVALDVGGLLLQPLYEELVHQGIDQALLVHLSWHGGG